MNTSWLRLASAAVASGSLGVVFGTSLRPVTAEEKVSPPPVKLVERATRDPKWKSFRQATIHSGIKAGFCFLHSLLGPLLTLHFTI